MSQDHFTLTFDGEALDNGLMEVRELAPALLAAGDLIQNANRILNGDRSKVSLQVKSDFKHGSFDIGLLLDQSLIEQAKQLLDLHPNVRDAKELLDILFFYAGIPGGAVFGLFKLIRWLRGRRIESGQITFINEVTVNINIGNESINVTRPVLALAQDAAVRKAAQGVVAPLKRDGIDELRLDAGGDRTETVDKSDALFFEFGYREGETLLENDREAVLAIVRLSFKREHKWGFTDGTTKIRAHIDDNKFWDDIQSGAIHFSKGDHVLVRIRTRTFRVEDGDLKSEYVIEEVIRLLPRYRQISLL